MRYRLMATYRGALYEAGVGPSDGSVVLFAACPPPEELGFEPATGHWRKELRLADVQAVADRAVVLRLGRNNGEFRIADVSYEDIIAAITGATDNAVTRREAAIKAQHDEKAAQNEEKKK